MSPQNSGLLDYANRDQLVAEKANMDLPLRDVVVWRIQEISAGTLDFHNVRRGSQSVLKIGENGRRSRRAAVCEEMSSQFDVDIVVQSLAEQELIECRNKRRSDGEISLQVSEDLRRDPSDLPDNVKLSEQIASENCERSSLL